MKPIVIVENASKIYAKHPDAHLGYGVRDLLGEVFGRRERSLREDEFFAVHDISFALDRGDTLAVIGRNGSGKTTLLRMMAGLIKPDAGRIMMDGRVQALVALGAGFNAKLSGRENVINAAALMGLGRNEALGVLDEIIDFSELEEFIDSPVETYSSGMYARLGFSVSIYLKPDILLIDEILAVGDHAFQNKCFVRMHELKKQGATIILVTHSHTQAGQLCDQALWLRRAKAVRMGSSKEVIKDYLAYLSDEEVARVGELNRMKQEWAEPTSVQVNSGLYGAIYDDLDNVEDVQVDFVVNGAVVDSLAVHDRLLIRYRFDLKARVRDLNVSLSLWRKDGLHITTISTLNGDLLRPYHDGRIRGEVEIPDFNFAPGHYVLVMPIHEGHGYLYRNVVKEFAVTGRRTMTWGLVDFHYDYQVGHEPLNKALRDRAKTIEVSPNQSIGPGDINGLELGPELAPDDPRHGTDGAGAYHGTYRARIEAVSWADGPGVEGVDKVCLKIESDGCERSGIGQTDGRFTLKKDARYLLQCRVYCGDARTTFRLGIQMNHGTTIWSANLDNRSVDYVNRPGAWTRCQGVLHVTDETDDSAQVWIVHWDKSPLTWYLGDVSLREIIQSSENR